MILATALLASGCSRQYPYTFVNVGQETIHVTWFGPDPDAEGFEFDLPPGSAMCCERFGGGLAPPPEVISRSLGNRRLTLRFNAAAQADGNSGYVLPIDGSGHVLPVGKARLSYRR